MPRSIVMRIFVGAIVLALLSSCGGGSGVAPLSITASSPPAGTTGADYVGYAFQASGAHRRSIGPNRGLCLRALR